MKRYTGLLMALTLTAGMTLQAQTNEFVIQTKKLGAEIQPTMYGLFFEDINYAADGGLYAELVKNRSFEFPQNLMGWKTFGNVTLQDDGPLRRILIMFACLIRDIRISTPDSTMKDSLASV